MNESSRGNNRRITSKSRHKSLSVTYQRSRHRIDLQELDWYWKRHGLSQSVMCGTEKRETAYCSVMCYVVRRDNGIVVETTE